MLFDYQCKKCEKIIEVEKSIKDPHPSDCPLCDGGKLERFFAPDSVPAVTYANRPYWTYNDIKRYKNMRIDGGTPLKIDPSKHGDMGSWHSNAEVDKSTETRSQKHEKLLRNSRS